MKKYLLLLLLLPLLSNELHAKTLNPTFVNNSPVSISSSEALPDQYSRTLNLSLSSSSLQQPTKYPTKYPTEQPKNVSPQKLIKWFFGY